MQFFNPLIQTTVPPLQSEQEVNDYYQQVTAQLNWESVGIFIDDEVGRQCGILILLLTGEKVVGIFRLCLVNASMTYKALQRFMQSSDELLTFRALQGQCFSQQDIQSLEAIESLWTKALEQTIELEQQAQLELFEKLYTPTAEKGRGKDFSLATKRKVNADAYGRCMFEGCGAVLNIDELTGQAGNYGYLAHNVASAENGPRGIAQMSGHLSDDPNNVLLLCDKHHRLIDKVAAVDYPAWRLSAMRRDFCDTATQLLKGLTFEAVPAMAISWPVQRNVIAPPSDLQIAQSLAKLSWRMKGGLISPSNDNDAMLRDCTFAQLKPLWLTLIEKAAQNINSSIGTNQYRCGLFAFGPMPQLIALGAKLGNKQEIIPMLRYRDGNQWVWPADHPQGNSYQVFGLDALENTEDEVILTLSFTNHPPEFENMSAELNLKVVEVKANAMGSGAIGHPDDGIEFMAHMQRLLHQLKDQFGVKKIHLLPCASNAVCVFFGKAYDLYQPQLLVYDFDKQAKGGMVPVFNVSTQDGLCQILLA